jgi:hypothetical protein
MLVDGWCGGIFEEAGSKDGRRSPGTDSCGKGFYRKPRLIAGCSAMDDDGDGTTYSMTFSMLNYSLRF